MHNRGTCVNIRATATWAAMSTHPLTPYNGKVEIRAVHTMADRQTQRKEGKLYQEKENSKLKKNTSLSADHDCLSARGCITNRKLTAHQGGQGEKRRDSGGFESIVHRYDSAALVSKRESESKQIHNEAGPYHKGRRKGQRSGTPQKQDNTMMKEVRGKRSREKKSTKWNGQQRRVENGKEKKREPE